MKNFLLICSAFTLFITPIASAQQSGMPIPGQEPLLTSICMTCHGAYGQGNPVVGGPPPGGHAKLVSEKPARILSQWLARQ